MQGTGQTWSIIKKEPPDLSFLDDTLTWIDGPRSSRTKNPSMLNKPEYIDQSHITSLSTMRLNYHQSTSILHHSATSISQAAGMNIFFSKYKQLYMCMCTCMCAMHIQLLMALHSLSSEISFSNKLVVSSERE